MDKGANMLVADLHGHVPRQIAQLAHHVATAQLLSDLASHTLMVADDSISTVTEYYDQ